MLERIAFTDVMMTLALLAVVAGVVALLVLVERAIAVRRRKPTLGGQGIEGMKPPAGRGNAMGGVIGGSGASGGDAGCGSGGDGGGCGS